MTSNRIVGVGASAGGLQAFGELLRCLPAETDMAFVLIQHLDRTHSSLLSKALQKATPIPVLEAQSGMRVEAGRVYVIAPNTELMLAGGHLAVSPRRAESAPAFLPVDVFMRSLAAELGGDAVGVILSGSASDGTEGLRAIKAQHGTTLVQRPGSARFAGMPQSAVDAGVADHCLDIPDLARELVRIGRSPSVHEPGAIDADATVRHEILARLQSAYDVDFSKFKPATITRRLARRVGLRGASDLTAYLRALDAEPAELSALYEDLLIHVTGFFRDPEVFEALRSSVLPQMYEHKAADAPVRAWVAGCATGEEVYSIAIMLIELGEQCARTNPIQVFGSDLSEDAIRKARAGVYSDGALRGLSDERRRRYMTKVDGGFRINKEVRELCVFVRHDVVHDPPLSKMDLVCCRNVLIYFDVALQRKVMPVLHYALSQPGFLVLGRCESIAAFDHLFSLVDKTHKIFKRGHATSDLRLEPRLAPEAPPGRAPQRARGSVRTDSARIGRHVDQLLLARYAPPGVLIDEHMNVLMFQGHTGAYLEVAPGQPQHHLIGMARDGLIAALCSALARAKQDGVPVRQSDVVVDTADSSRRCDVVVIPFSGFHGSVSPLYIVLFEARPRLDQVETPADPQARALDATSEERRRARLEHELAATRAYLQTLVEDRGRANEELTGLNEDLMSGNEELQSMNEELETAKEELQSSNEELITLNDELRVRNQEVEKLASDAENARAQAERSNGAKDDFLATLSHELRTPLSTMLLQAQQLRSGTLSEASALMRAGAALERATWTQVHLIDDLLDVSRIVAGKLVINRLRVDLCELVRVALQGIGPLLEAKALALTVSFDPVPIAVFADAGRIQQAVTNLLTNALKFTPRGGRVTAVVERMDGQARVRVSDTGIGISAEYLPNVFTRFSQSDTSITRKYGGLGLGLALVRHIVDLHGGSVRAESAGEGHGASFSITLPLAPLEAPAAAAVAPDAQGSDRPAMLRRYEELVDLRVLFVDDDPSTREAVREVLLYTGAQIELAASAAQGMAALETFKPDVLLCDIAMPHEDGYAFMRKVRSRELGGGGAMPALALTALATEEDRKRALAAGFDMHLAKPIDIDHLRDAVLELSRHAKRGRDDRIADPSGRSAGGRELPQ